MRPPGGPEALTGGSASVAAGGNEFDAPSKAVRDPVVSLSALCGGMLRNPSGASGGSRPAPFFRGRP